MSTHDQSNHTPRPPINPQTRIGHVHLRARQRHVGPPAAAAQPGVGEADVLQRHRAAVHREALALQVGAALANAHLYEMAKLTGGGFTNLPPDRKALKVKLDRSHAAFARDEETIADELFEWAWTKGKEEAEWAGMSLRVG